MEGGEGRRREGEDGEEREGKMGELKEGGGGNGLGNCLQGCPCLASGDAESQRGLLPQHHIHLSGETALQGRSRAIRHFPSYVHPHLILSCLVMLSQPTPSCCILHGPLALPPILAARYCLYPLNYEPVPSIVPVRTSFF